MGLSGDIRVIIIKRFDMKINVITLFSGYDSQCLALDRLKEMHPDFDYCL